ncbi:MAG: hypothetical protein FWD69_05185 [Polyangiaceae bacterium]|nr:hypothetical protein [Polyangiaceae bacterium]
MLGFEIAERFEGSFYLLREPFTDLTMRVSLQLGVGSMRRFLRDRTAKVDGTIFAEGLAEGDGNGVALRGTLTWKLFDEKRIPYDLFFDADDGRACRMRGQRDFFIHDAALSLTVLHASIYDERGSETGRVTLRFNPKKELLPTLKSFRPRLRIPLISG